MQTVSEFEQYAADLRLIGEGAEAAAIEQLVEALLLACSDLVAFGDDAWGSSRWEADAYLLATKG